MSVGLFHYLILAASLFAIGLFGLLKKKNLIVVLMSIELMLNAANLNLVAFNRFLPIEKLEGQLLAIFSMMVGAAEIAVGLALAFRICHDRKTILLDALERMKG